MHRFFQLELREPLSFIVNSYLCSSFNSVVFDKGQPSIQVLVCTFEEDYHLWRFIGAENLKSFGRA
jgi:hypothetical protein